MPYKDPEKRRERQRAYAQRWYAENKERQRAYAQKPEVRERKRAYMQEYLANPEVRERKRAYAQRWYAENKERQRAYRHDINRLKKRLDLDDSGVAAIMAAVAAGQRYSDIAADWLIDEVDVSHIANAHGVVRRPRKAVAKTDAEVRT